MNKVSNKRMFNLILCLLSKGGGENKIFMLLNYLFIPCPMQLVEGMQEEGVLRALGSQPVPMRSDGVRVSHDLPATGNMLEMQDWKPPSYRTVLLQKQGKRFTSTAPSQR